LQEVAAIAVIGINGIGCAIAKKDKDLNQYSHGRKFMSEQAAEHHRKAAEHLQQAALHHKEAAKQHETGKHEKAAHHAHLARGHQDHAMREAAEAAEEYILIYPTTLAA